MTFEEMLEIEPGLRELLEYAKSQRHVDGFCANEVWYGAPPSHGMIEAFQGLVGWDARNPALRSSECYDAAYNAIYEALPDCRHEGPCRG